MALGVVGVPEGEGSFQAKLLLHEYAVLSKRIVC